MPRKVLFSLVVLTVSLVLSSCSMMAGMTGKGDIVSALENRDRVMKDMTPGQRVRHIRQKQTTMLEYGRHLFGDASLGTNGQTCESCHPGGGTTGAEAQVPMRDYRIPIPTLSGASARFPKYKMPNDRVITLAQMTDNCIRLFLDGKGVLLNSREAVALSMYVSSLSNGQTVQIGKSD